MGTMVSRKLRELTEEDIDKFAEELKRKLKAQLEDDTIIILS